ncbi:MAG: sulfur oxidation c-type cytochrome SoxX [Rhodospirillales bacterium]
MRRRAGVGCGLAAALLAGAAPAAEDGIVPYVVVGDAIPAPLTDAPGDAARGRAIVADRQVGLCLLCHGGPFPQPQFHGDLAPDLRGAGDRWTAGQLRLRIVDASRANPATIMPPYYRADGLDRVGAAWQGRTVLSAQQVEDVVAFLATLRNGGEP